MALGTAGTLAAAAVVAGAVGAGTAFVLREPAPVSSPSPGAADSVPALQERLDRQEKEIASLRARVEEAAAARGPSRPAHGPGAGGPGEPEPWARDPSDPADPRPLDAPRAGPSSADMASMSPEERAKYETVYKALREKEQEEGRRARLAAYETGLRARLDRLPERLALTPEQKDAAARILLARGEKLRALFDEARTTGGADAYRAAQEKADGIRKEAHDLLAQSLTVEQVEAVESPGDRGAPARGQGFGGRAGSGRRGTRNEGAGGGEPAPR